jgi:CBS domain containing-hemolysin-like protein
VNPGAAVAAVLLLVANAFFVAVEFALMASRRTRIEALAAEGDARAKAAATMLRTLSLQLAGAQLGITMASLGLGAVAEPAVAQALESAIGAVASLPEGVLHTVSFVVALTIVVFLHMVVGEMVPKNIAIASAETLLLWLALPMRAFVTVFGPVIRFLNVVANLGVRAVGVEPRDEVAMAHTADELAALVTASREEGLLEDFEHRLLSGALRFQARSVASVMVPWERVDTVPRTATVGDVERVVVESGHSRLPVVDEGDEVIGFVHAKDLLRLGPELSRRPLPYRLLRRMVVTREDRTLEQLLRAMRRLRLHFALVVDGDGTKVGVVTLEDVVEQLVGSIRDETDPEEEAAPARGRR